MQGGERLVVPSQMPQGVAALVVQREDGVFGVYDFIQCGQSVRVHSQGNVPLCGRELSVSRAANLLVHSSIRSFPELQTVSAVLSAPYFPVVFIMRQTRV